jgi:hypothetical protein
MPSPPVADRDTILLTPVEVATGDDIDDTDDTDTVSDPLDPVELARGVDALVLDEADYPSLDPVEAYDLRRAIEAQGMAQLSRKDGIAVFVRILDEDVQVVGG